MFKKLKDKLAEEVKSSPQRIQQFAQAAQAAVTSASSSISDITNNDLFSIGDNDNPQNRSMKAQASPHKQANTYQDVTLVQPGSMQATTEAMDYGPNQEESQRQRRLSNSSFASDVSFRLPSYESPSMYHLQSDMEVSASEAEERGITSGTVSLDRVTKEQIYAAYRRTQERYTKYRTQYADLARHYKLLERENAKAKSVLVETQDKALRRISELREQCTLEQSAKAHLEKAMRVDIEERNMKIETLNTKIKFLQSNFENRDNFNCENNGSFEPEKDAQLINLSVDSESKETNDNSISGEVITLNNKIEKMEQLLNKYKESLRLTKDKNSQMTTELQIISNELESKKKENDELNVYVEQLDEARQTIQELNDTNEELQNKINAYDFTKTKEKSALEIDYQKAQEEITQLRDKISVFTKREEENAISLAENKLSIHKELESKEAEIKSLKESLSASHKEIQSLNIVVSDYKKSTTLLEDECAKNNQNIKELNITKAKILELEEQIQDMKGKHQSLETTNAKADEEYKCLNLQLKQETAEKLAMIDRNTYLENRITQLSEENGKKSLHISNLENELKDKNCTNITEKGNMRDEIAIWKDKYRQLESEIQEEREELVKLQSEIEKLLANYELIQIQNTELHAIVSDLRSENANLQQNNFNNEKIKQSCEGLIRNVQDLRQIVSLTSQETKTLKVVNNNAISAMQKHFCNLLNKMSKTTDNEIDINAYEKLQTDFDQLEMEFNKTIENNQRITNENQSLLLKNDELKSKIETIELETNKNQSELNIALDRLESLSHEKQRFLESIKDMESKNQQLKTFLDSKEEQHAIVIHTVDELKQANQNLVQEVKNIENENLLLSTEVDKLKNENADNALKINELNEENNSLKDKLEDSYNKNTYIHKLEENIKTLTQENISLKSQCEMIANNVRLLESELSEVRKSHLEIENEKNHLNSTIEKLERNELDRAITYTKYTQTDMLNEPCQKFDVASNTPAHEEIEQYAVLEQEIMSLKEANVQLSNNLHKINTNSQSELTESFQKFDTLKDDYDSLKEENRRLQSDISGLQTYLTKISKENSVLNDKLRELIASSENSDKNEALTRNITDMTKEKQLEKDKMDDFIRENALLIEENLELKDQLNSQNYVNSPENEASRNNKKDMEFNNLKEQYKNLQESKTKLERRLADLDEMNNSVTRSMGQMQENNDKLRLSNEKLERRLDEALVSLRHLHSLQENTELEYLRNILYEYLTGSGTHSLTLAKVLAAVVKFDPTQTEQVLQKEKERQGLLRQLGLL